MTLKTNLPYKNRKYATIQPDSDGLSPIQIQWQYAQFIPIENGVSLRGRALSISPLGLPYTPKDFDAAKVFPIDLIIDFYKDGMKYREKDDDGNYQDKSLSGLSNFEKYLFHLIDQDDFAYQWSGTLNINSLNEFEKLSKPAELTKAENDMIFPMIFSGLTVLDKQDNSLPEPLQNSGGGSYKRTKTLAEKLDELSPETIKLLSEKAFAIRSQCGVLDAQGLIDPMQSPSLKTPLTDIVLGLISGL